MVKTYESRFPPSPNLDKVTVSFDKLNNTDLFLQIHGVYINRPWWPSGLVCHVLNSSRDRRVDLGWMCDEKNSDKWNCCGNIFHSGCKLLKFCS